MSIKSDEDLTECASYLSALLQMVEAGTLSAKNMASLLKHVKDVHAVAVKIRIGEGDARIRRETNTETNRVE